MTAGPALDAVQPAVRRAATAPALWLGAACLVVHLVANGHYGLFRDELYFIVCGLRPAFGYVDQPPLIPLIAAASFKLFGTALTPLRFVPALAAATAVALAADLAGRLGGGRFAQTLAGLCVLLTPTLMTFGVLLTTHCLQPPTWLACAWILTRRIEGGDERWWLALGAVVGVSLESYDQIALFLVGLAVGVVATPLRRSLARPWVYAGAGLALALASPNLVWQARHHWPFLQVVGDNLLKNVAQAPLASLLQQAFFVGSFTAPVWLAGLWRLVARPPRPELRALGIACVVVVAVVVGAGGRAYYSAFAYPILFSAGAVAWEAWLRRPAAQWAAATLVAVFGIRAAPTTLPILPPATLVAYMQATHYSVKDNQFQITDLGDLPPIFADMFGWPELAAAVSAVYRGLPPDERAQAVFFANNYGEAAALDLYGPALGGPPTISGNTSYYLWGPGGASGEVLIALGRGAPDFPDAYDDIRAAGRTDAAFAKPSETGLTIWVMRRPRTPLAAIWPLLKRF
ncbi:MAG: glycosyltransferase family 39 protein [Roseiarcus sp.]